MGGARAAFSSRSRRGTAQRACGLGIWLGIVASYAVGTWMPDAVVNYYQQSIAVGVLMFLACALWQAAWQYAPGSRCSCGGWVWAVR